MIKAMMVPKHPRPNFLAPQPAIIALKNLFMYMWFLLSS